MSPWAWGAIGLGVLAFGKELGMLVGNVTGGLLKGGAEAVGAAGSKVGNVLYDVSNSAGVVDVVTTDPVGHLEDVSEQEVTSEADYKDGTMYVLTPEGQEPDLDAGELVEWMQ